jgi:hypothetical protein
VASIFYRARLLLLLLLSLILALRQAQAMEKTDDIDTNRPSFMNSPLVVPKGSLQFENGGLYQHFDHGLNTYDLPEAEMRLGLTKSIEFQAFVPNYNLYHQQSSAVTDTPDSNRAGVADLQDLGLKIQLPSKIKDLNVAIIGAITIPTGRRLFSNAGVEPAVRVPWGKSLSKNWSIMGQQSILVVDAGRDVEWQNFWMLNRAIGTRSSVFAEYGGFYTKHTIWANIAHFGAVRKLNKNNQIDMQFGFGLNRAAPAAFIGVGYSFRLDRLPVIDKL